MIFAQFDTVMLELLGQVPAAAAVIIVVIRFLAFLKDERVRADGEMIRRNDDYLRQIGDIASESFAVSDLVRTSLDANTKQMAKTDAILNRVAELVDAQVEDPE